MRLLYDSTTAADIPADAPMVAGYVDGRYRWSDADWARFPHAVKVRIAVFASTQDGHVLDVETGDAMPDQAPRWAFIRRRQGVDPSIYVNRANWFTVRQAFQADGIPEPHYWLSTLDGSQPWAPGIVAVQYAGSRRSGGHYDLSAVLDHWPGVDVGPPLAPGGLHMDPDVNNTFRKLAINGAVDTLGLELTDAELDGYWHQLAEDFHNLRAVIDQIKAAHPRAGASGAHTHA